MAKTGERSSKRSGSSRLGLSVLAVVGIFFGAIMARAAVSVQASVDREKLGAGQVLTVTLQVLSTESVQVGKPRPPDFEGFELLNAWDATAVSQKLVQTPQGMDFQTQRRYEYNYRLRPLKTGRLSIGSFDVAVDGRTQTTQPLLVEVSEQPAANEEETQLPGGMAWPGVKTLEDLERADEELFNQLLQRRQQMLDRPEPQFRSKPNNPNEAFFIQVEIDKTEVYEGEQITVAWYILTRGQMESLDRVKFPDLRGFWKEIIEEVPAIQFSEEIINGVPYKKALLAAHALFPIKAGTAVIDEYKIKSRVRMPQRGLGGYGFGPAYEYTKSSPRVSVKVKPLPLEGRPANFTGAVGDFDVTAQVDSNAVPAHQPFILRVRFEGAGNAKGIELPAIEWPPGLELYDTKSESRFFKNGRSYKNFDVYVVPRQEGEVVIPPISVAMFDPKTGTYAQRTTHPITLKVAPGQAPSAAKSGAGSDAGSGSATRAPTGPRLPDPVLAYGSALPHWPFLGSGAFWVVIFGLVFVILAVKARVELSSDFKRRDLALVADKKLKKIDGLLRKNDARAVGVEMGNLFQVVLGEAAGRTGASEELERVLERVSPSLRRDLGDEIRRKMDFFQVLGYAPEEASRELRDAKRVQGEVDQTRKLVRQMIKRLTEESDATS